MVAYPSPLVVGKASAQIPMYLSEHKQGAHTVNDSEGEAAQWKLGSGIRYSMVTTSKTPSVTRFFTRKHVPSDTQGRKVGRE